MTVKKYVAPVVETGVIDKDSDLFAPIIHCASGDTVFAVAKDGQISVKAGAVHAPMFPAATLTYAEAEALVKMLGRAMARLRGEGVRA